MDHDKNASVDYLDEINLARAGANKKNFPVRDESRILNANQGRGETLKK